MRPEVIHGFAKFFLSFLEAVTSGALLFIISVNILLKLSTLS